MSSLLKICVTCFSTAGGPTVSRSAIPLLDSPSAINASTSRSRGVSASSGSVAPPPAEHPGDHLGVQRRAPAAHRPHGVDEVAQVRDPVLEHVPDAARVVAHQLVHVPLHEVLGEHQHAHVGLLAPDLQRRAQPVVGEVRRHPHVDDGHVRLVPAHLAQQVGRVRRARHHLDPGLLEQPRDPLAQEQLVVGDHGTHGATRRPRRISKPKCSAGTVGWVTARLDRHAPWVRSNPRVTEPTIIAPDEELDISTVDTFRAELQRAIENSTHGLVVDLSEVGFIDSTGLSAILHANSKLKRDGRRLAIVAPRGTAAAMLFTLSGLRSELAIYDSTRAAVRS